MSQQDTVQVQLQLVVADFQRSAKDAAAAMASLAREVGGAAGAGRKPVEDADRAQKGWLKTLGDFRKEQIQQGRQTRFLAGEIAGLVAPIDGASGAMTGLVGLFLEGAAGGLGFGLALEGAKFVIGQVAEAFAEAKRQAEAQAQAHRSLIGLVADHKQAMAEYLGVSEATTKVREEQKAYAAEMTRLTEELEKLKEKGRGWAELAGSMFGHDTGAYRGQLHAIEAQITAVGKAARAAADSTRALFDAKKAIDREEELRKASADRAKDLIAREYARSGELAQLRAQGASASAAASPATTEVQKVGLEMRAAIEASEIAINAERAKGKEADLLEIQHLEKKLELQLGLLDAKMKAAEQKDRAEQIRSEVASDEASGAFSGYEDDSRGLVETQRAQAERAQQLTEAVTQQQLQWIGQVENAWANAIQGMLSGQLSLAQGIRALWQGIVQSVIGAVAQILAKQATAALAEAIIGKTSATAQALRNQAVAITGAMAAMAGVPLVGPVLAAEAGAAMAAATAPYVVQAGSAAGGADLPAFIGGRLFQLHSKEMVLPEPHADVIRDLADGGGGRGDNFYVTIHALDGASVRRVLESDDAIAALRRNARRGRG